MRDDSVELETVERYLDEHFNPIRRLLGAKIPDPDVRKVALRRCTRHIFHWRQDAIGGPGGPDHADYGEPVKPENGAGENGASNGDDSEEAVDPDERPPEEWATGGEPEQPSGRWRCSRTTAYPFQRSARRRGPASCPARLRWCSGVSVHEVLEHGPIVTHDEERGLLVTVNGAYLNLWVECGDAFENSDCRHPGSRVDGRGLGELSVAEVMELAEGWLDELRADGEE